MWNNTDIPLALFFTFRCYGTWLHGDERGAIDRHDNVFRTPRLPANTKWLQFNKTLLKHGPVILRSSQRTCVERSIKHTCSLRDWNLLALNVRTNHIHSVISIGSAKPKRALGALKANATRQMREEGLWRLSTTPWAEKGSGRYLWTDKSVGEAVGYVMYEQGEKLPDFDWWWDQTAIAL